MTITMPVSDNGINYKVQFDVGTPERVKTPMGEHPASGKRIKIPAVQVFTLQGGKITESHQYFDSATLMQQVGAMPAPVGANR